MTSYLSSTPSIGPNDSEREKNAEIPPVQMATVARGAIIEKLMRTTETHFFSSLYRPGLTNLYIRIEKNGNTERDENKRISVHLTSTQSIGE